MKHLPLPSQARLKEVLDYNKDTGVFRWKNPPSRRMKPGDKAGTKQDYIRIFVDKTLYQAQRLAWLYMTGEDPGEYQIDHRDENKYNNAFSNLRKATSSTNKMNVKTPKYNSTGYKGVQKQKNRYIAHIGKNGKKYHLGSYKTPEEAHKAYCEAADKYFGEFANYG